MTGILERLRHLDKFEWAKMTEPCNAVLTVYEGRCALTEIERLAGELAEAKQAPGWREYSFVVAERDRMTAERNLLFDQHAPLVAERDALQAQLTEAEASYTTRYDDGYAQGYAVGEAQSFWKAKADALRAQVEGMREALERYGGHSGDCATNRSHYKGPVYDCDCGWPPAALRGSAPPTDQPEVALAKECGECGAAYYGETCHHNRMG